jgi:hypothetical protein
MERTPVVSSNIASVGYDPAQQILEVAFHSGRIYQYHNVPQRIYQGLMQAPSHGRYFDSFIKKAGYPYYRVR